MNRTKKIEAVFFVIRDLLAIGIALLISFLLIFLSKGAAEIASAYSLNDYASDIITGVILFFILASEFFVNYKMIFRSRAGKGVK